MPSSILALFYWIRITLTTSQTGYWNTLTSVNLIKSEFFIHRKHNHPELVKKCKNEERCKYEVCWFLHEKGSDQKNIIQNKTQIEKLVEMVENISDRVCKIEKNGKWITCMKKKNSDKWT